MGYQPDVLRNYYCCGSDPMKRIIGSKGRIRYRKRVRINGRKIAVVTK